jgi:hypothetical protein
MGIDNLRCKFGLVVLIPCEHWELPATKSKQQERHRLPRQGRARLAVTTSWAWARRTKIPTNFQPERGWRSFVEKRVFQRTTERTQRGKLVQTVGAVSKVMPEFSGADDAQFTVEIAVNDGIFKITAHAYPLLQRSLPARSAIDAGPATTRTSQSL